MSLPVQVSLVVSVIFSFLSWRRIRVPPTLVWPLVSAALSSAYVAFYLRGGPRIIDAAAYFLEARTFGSGSFWEHANVPEASIMGRFLLTESTGPTTRFAPIFPPGYPAVLALGFVLHHPMAVGPLLAALLTWMTTKLASEVCVFEDPVIRSRVTAVAAVASALAGALRYHTSDTMSHGAAALWLALALERVLFARRAGRRGPFMIAGLALGMLAATRPLSAVTPAILLGGIALTSRRGGLVHLALGLAPGLVLLLFHQHALTGSWLSSSQLAYYARSDGPADCFGVGLSGSRGCQGEHGDFVAAYQHGVFGIQQAILTTLRRLKAHGPDALNAELLWLAVAWGLRRSWPQHGGRTLGMALAGHILTYAFFYFDGSYPGGGGRMFADLLPLEHVLAGLGLVQIFRSWSKPRIVWSVAALLVAAFALRAEPLHAHLQAREGGMPMFVPQKDMRPHDPVFVDTDHGFLIARGWGYEALRLRGDAFDARALELLGNPNGFRYAFDRNSGVAQYTRFSPTPSQRVNAASLWPAVRQAGAWAWRERVDAPCTQGREVLRVRLSGASQYGSVTLASLPSPGQTAVLILGPGAVAKFAGDSWITGPDQGTQCTTVPLRGLDLELTLTIRGSGLVALDSLQLGP